MGATASRGSTAAGGPYASRTVIETLPASLMLSSHDLTLSQPGTRQFTADRRHGSTEFPLHPHRVGRLRRIRRTRSAGTSGCLGDCRRMTLNDTASNVRRTPPAHPPFAARRRTRAARTRPGRCTDSKEEAGGADIRRMSGADRSGPRSCRASVSRRCWHAGADRDAGGGRCGACGPLRALRQPRSGGAGTAGWTDRSRWDGSRGLLRAFRTLCSPEWVALTLRGSQPPPRASRWWHLRSGSRCAVGPWR